MNWIPSLIGLALWFSLLGLPGASSVALADSADVEAGSPGLSMPDEQWQLEGANLGRDELFARVDSLESAVDRADENERASLKMRLAQLYLSTDLFKHRRHALALLEEVLEESPESYQAAALWATMAQRMRYLSDARKRLQQSVDEFPNDPRPNTHLGRFYFREARRRMLTKIFAQAAENFELALAIDGEYVEAWRGLAITRLALQQYAEAAEAARAWAERSPQDERPRWVEAASLAGSDSVDRAEVLFDELLETAPVDVRNRFAGDWGLLGRPALEAIARGVLPQRVVQAVMRADDPGWTVVDKIDWGVVLEDSTARRLAVETYWKLNNSRPTKDYNSNQVLFWRRLVEADVLFGDPEKGSRGWDTEMGDAWVRWGPPTSTFYDPGTASSILSDLSVAGVKLTVADEIPQNTRIWVWTYRRPGVWFSLMFLDPTMNSQWMTSSATAENVALRTRSEPISFYDGPTPSSPYELALSTAVFPRTDYEAVLETYLRVDGSSGSVESDTLAVVEWALFDDLNNRVDYRREALASASTLNQLIAGDEENDCLLWTVGARVAPGRYRVAVEVSNARGGERSSTAFDVDVREPGPPGFLELSDVQIARHFEEYESGASTPLRFVKFGQVVIPAPSQRVSADAERLGVYFEVREPAVDEAGLTSLDVVYEVFEDRQRLRSLVSDREFRRDKLERIDPLSSVFLNERTGVSREGVVIKGTDLPIATLGRGNFLVLVTVTDRISGQSASRAAWFRRSRS